MRDRETDRETERERKKKREREDGEREKLISKKDKMTENNLANVTSNNRRHFLSSLSLRWKYDLICLRGSQTARIGVAQI